MISAKYGLNGTIKQISSTSKVPWRTSLHLATTISRVLQPQDGRIRCLVDRNREIFLTSTLILCSFLDSVEIIVNKICFWIEK